MGGERDPSAGRTAGRIDEAPAGPNPLAKSSLRAVASGPARNARERGFCQPKRPTASGGVRSEGSTNPMLERSGP